MLVIKVLSLLIIPLTYTEATMLLLTKNQRAKLSMSVAKNFQFDRGSNSFHTSNNDHTEDIIIVFGNSEATRAVLDAHSYKKGKYSREEMLKSFTTELTELSAQQQAGAIKYAKDNGFDHKCLWSANSLVVKAATADCVKKMAAFTEVTFIRGIQTFALPPLEDLDRNVKASQVSLNSDTSSLPSFFKPKYLINWGLKTINVEDAWKFTSYGKRARGKGIVVGSIDTGVRREHYAVRENFREDHGWYDAYFGSEQPEDADGHGTYTTSIMAGRYGFGVAPDCEWIACRGCSQDFCKEDALLACAQFMLCPTDADGNNPDCSKAPHVVSNSWGGGQDDQFYMNAIMAFQLADIVPVFAIGNDGPNCYTSQSPGDYSNVIGVGSTDPDDAVVYFSSRGPAVVTNHVKPDFCAPGLWIRGAWNENDEIIVIASGTSASCPFVSGLVALVLSINYDLKYEDIYEVLAKTAEKNYLADSSSMCASQVPSIYPNAFCGHGRIDAYRAVKYAAYLGQILEKKTSSSYTNSSESTVYSLPSSYTESESKKSTYPSSPAPSTPSYYVQPSLSPIPQTSSYYNYKGSVSGSGNPFYDGSSAKQLFVPYNNYA